MGDYKADQDRFFDSLQDLKEFREAAEGERIAGICKTIDDFVKTAIGTMFDSEEEGREWTIERLKSMGKVPREFRYPESPNRD